MSAAVLDLLRQKTATAFEAVRKGRQKAALSALRDLDAMLQLEQASVEEQPCRCGCDYAEPAS